MLIETYYTFEMVQQSRSLQLLGHTLMRKVILPLMLITTLAIVAHVPGRAADLGAAPILKAPVVTPVYNWTGLYIGINGGGGRGSSHFIFPGAGTTTGDFNISGGLVGGTIGYNYQVGRVVLGLEDDVDWTNIKGSAVCPDQVTTCETSNNWLGTAHGRIGVAWDRFLPYVTGGAAFGEVRAKRPTVGSLSRTSAGWTVGGGLEAAIAGNWSVKVEYLHVSLDRFTCTQCSTVGDAVDITFRADVVRGGINYRF